MRMPMWMYEYHRNAVYDYRSAHDLTQEKIAEHLKISVRCYWNQEHGRHGFSGNSILVFLLLIGEEERKIYFRELEKRFRIASAVGEEP